MTTNDKARLLAKIVDIIRAEQNTASEDSDDATEQDLTAYDSIITLLEDANLLEETETIVMVP